ncbi:sugar phosphate permease [Leucobacter exalbidus]|uniref:Lysosomal dipeptide transporter MFSD1 n=1 Tax=Leucobacter exalbidus TaxID=662960 RepID=A0A940PRX4_9MICO|nr:MFS transporter [Leucobacter exalbidus]MBP1325663.1 sugar phosphate permease [Leucobacter exalbidus]
MRTARPLLPWFVWGVAAIAYAVAVINRSSLAALGPATQHHFDIDATTLAAFPVIQLVVYAALQIPVGILLDKVGTTNMVLGGGVLMLIGQTAMATVDNVWLAVLARVLVGAGDACTFISVMRMLPEWFAVRQLPTVSQVTGLIGQAGQLVSVTPLALLVGAVGWTQGFLGLAAVGLLVTILGAFVMRDRPGAPTLVEQITGRRGKLTLNARSLAGEPEAVTSSIGPPQTSTIPLVDSHRGFEVIDRARRMLRIPGIRLAFWLHFTSPFAANVFLLIWGTPFLTGGVGLSASQSGALLSITVVSSMVAGLVLGPLSSRFVERRVWINVGITLAIAIVWGTVFLWPGPPPLWLLLALIIVMPLGGPASMIAFEVLRSHSPRSFAGFATGLVNTGGFIASLIVILLIGLVLDVQGAGSPDAYSLTAFKWAFAVQVPLWVLGITMVLIERRRTQRWMAERGRRLR